VKTYSIELQRIKSMSNAHGLVRIQMDALVQPQSNQHADDEGRAPSSHLTLTEENARVLLIQLKAQLAEFDKRKPKSRF
jgi:hypothetical protein